MVEGQIRIFRREALNVLYGVCNKLVSLLGEKNFQVMRSESL
jgi:hypothetical protein